MKKWVEKHEKCLTKFMGGYLGIERNLKLPDRYHSKDIGHKTVEGTQHRSCTARAVAKWYTPWKTATNVAEWLVASTQVLAASTRKPLHRSPFAIPPHPSGISAKSVINIVIKYNTNYGTFIWKSIFLFIFRSNGLGCVTVNLLKSKYFFLL